MIYTSYYGMVKTLAKNGIEPIAISRSVPKGFTGRRILSLAPTWAMLKMSDAEYDTCYERILLENDRDAIVESFQGKDVALLCWESTVNECHRKRVGEWLREGGYEVQEFGRESKTHEKRKEQKPQTVDVEGKTQEWEQMSFVYHPPLA